MDGGLPKWITDNGPVATDAPPVTNGGVHYSVKNKVDLVRYINDIKEALERGDIQVILEMRERRYAG